MWFAIRHKRTKNFIYGTDFSYSPCRQRLSDGKSPPMFFSELTLITEIYRREINLKNFEVVKIEVNVTDVIPEEFIINRLNEFRR